MCLVQDGATSHIAHANFCKLMPWPPKSPDLNPIKGNWNVIGRVFRRRGLANVRRFTYTAISNGRMEQNYTAHVEMSGVHVCDINVQSLPYRHRSEWRSFQVLSPINLCCDDWVWKFYTCFDVIK